MAKLYWDQNNTPHSTVFEDIYYNPENGIEESLHVFVKGNGLPNRFNQYDNFVIGELGFGTGLNFFLTWKLFDNTNNNSDKKLHFFSVEKYPLSTEQIARALTPWADQRGDRLEQFCRHYPHHPKGVWSVDLSETVSLTVIFDDGAMALSGFNQKADAWYLDGFAPAKNPDMWSDDIFQHMARLSKTGTTFATFTAAGFVKRGLQSAGFDVRKEPGFGRKRERLVGEYAS